MRVVCRSRAPEAVLQNFRTTVLSWLSLFLQVVSADLFNPYDCCFIAFATQMKCQQVGFLLADPDDMFGFVGRYRPPRVGVPQWTKRAGDTGLSWSWLACGVMRLSEASVRYIQFLRGDLWLVCLQVKCFIVFAPCFSMFQLVAR